MDEFFWTTDPGEPWRNGPHPSREAALAEGRLELPSSVIYTGLLAPANLEAIMPDGEDILDHLRNAANDQGDSEGEWLSFVSREARDDLEDRVRAVIRTWLASHEEMPSFGLITEEETHAPLEAQP